MEQHGLTGCTDHRKWKKALGERKVRTLAMTYFKLNTWRCEDPVSLVTELIRFSHTDWFDSDTVFYRLLRAKETKSASMNAEAVRPAHQHAHGEMSTEVEWNRIKPVKDFRAPDNFLLMGIYNAIAKDRPKATLHTVVLPGESKPRQCKMFFIGDSKAFADRDLKSSTVSKLIKELLVTSGAIPPNSPLEAKHTRHTTLSYVHYKQKHKVEEALARSRHSKSVFQTTYVLKLSLGARLTLDAFPEGAQLEAVMAG